MNDKMFSFLVGIFSILSTIQFLIFDLNEVIILDYEAQFSIYMDPKPGVGSWVLIHKKNISTGLSTFTIMVSFLLLYCSHTKNYVGLLCYALWIVAYELTSFFMVLLINKNIKEQFKELSYMHLIFQISRMLLHFFCLPFIIKYTYTLYKAPKTSSKIGRRKRSSLSTSDYSWSAVELGTLYHKLN
uniref:Transmembrane protein 217 n=1 Tax=Rhinolophus ferrumequinum TaxID=59479 RepID=A0A671DHW6_RHIFE